MKDWVRPLRPELLMLGKLTQERARYILKHAGRFGEFKYSFRHEFLSENAPTHEDGINEVEDAYIKKVWSLMSGSSSYHDAVVAIAGGL